MIYTDYEKGYQQGKIDKTNEIIEMIKEHKKNCDSLGIVATVDWILVMLDEQNHN